MFGAMKAHIIREIEEIKQGGLYKAERIITSPQRMNITVEPDREVLNMCANNYLGLSDNPEVIQAAKDSFDKWGYGLSSVRFICGTQRIHKELEKRIVAHTGFRHRLDGEDKIIDEMILSNPEYFKPYMIAGEYYFSFNEMAKAKIFFNIALSKELENTAEKQLMNKKLKHIEKQDHN